MKVIELLEILEGNSKTFREKAVEQININFHMNNMYGKCKLSQDEVDAVLVSFMNHVAGSYGVDYGIKTTDLKEIVKCRCILCDYESTGKQRNDPKSTWGRTCGKCPRCLGGDLILDE